MGNILLGKITARISAENSKNGGKNMENRYKKINRKVML